MHSRPARLDFSRPFLILVTVLCVVGSGVASAQVPAEFQGDWVPSTSACTSPARVRFDAAKITLVNGADMVGFGGVEMAGPAYFEPSYRGIMAVAFAEFSGDQPVIATFNVGEKKGVAQLEMAAPSPGAASNTALSALNARYTALNLARRFPLNAVPLKRCPATTAAPTRR